MPPKRRPNRDGDELQPIGGGAAVTHDLPSLPSRFDTSYGSAPSTVPRNVRRGKVRNIQAAVQDALNDNDEDSDDDHAQVSKPKPKPKPKPNPIPKPKAPRPVQQQPDFGPGNDSDSDSPVAPRDPTPEQPGARDSPRHRPSGIAPTVEPASFQGDFPRGARAQRFLPGAAPPRGSDVAPPGRTPRRASSEGPVLPPSTNTSSRNPAASRLNPPGTGSLFQRAVSEDRDRYALRRSGSEDPVRTPDSTRTFGQESSLFGDAVIGSTPNKSPFPGNRPITTIEEEDSPVEAEDREATIVKSPTKRPVLRHPKHNPPMAPRSFNQTEPRDPVRSPITQVADGPPPGSRLPYNPSSPTKPESPRTPTRDQSQPHRPSPNMAPPPSAPRFVTNSVHVSPARAIGLPSVNRTNHQDSVQVSPALTTGLPSVNRTNHQDSVQVSPALNIGLPSVNRTNHHQEAGNAVGGPPVSSVTDSHRPHQPSQQGTPSPPRGNQARQPAVPSSQAGRIQPAVQQRPQPAEDLRRTQPPVADVRRNHRPGRDEPARNHGGLFDQEMQERVEEEREKDEAEQQALRSARKARLQAWPRIYAPIYSWTKTARPDTPPASPNGTPPRLPGRQTPMEQLGWGPWLMFITADTFVDVLGFIISPEAWLIRTAFAVLLPSFLVWTIFSGLSASPAFSLGGLQWYGFSDVTHNLGQFMPLWATRPSTIFSDEDTREYLRQQRDHEYEITKLMTSTKLHEGSLSKLEQIMPKIVRMELDKQGRPMVSQDFYHALRDLMKSDKEILTLDRGHGGYHYISDEHWRAIRDKLKKDPVYQKAANPPAPGVSPSQVEDIFQNNFSKSWEKWLRSNNQQVAKILEPAFGTSIPDKIEKDLGQKLEKYVKDLYKEKGTKDVIVTREEFIRHLKGEFATHRNEVKAEVQELQKNLEDFIAKSVDLAMSKAPPSGVSRAEMIHFVDDLVRQAIANAGLEALAKGKIGANWNHELRRQVNYLTIGGGTVIDPIRTSPTYKPKFKGSVGSPAWVDSTRRSPYLLPPSKTQVRWEDDGECWCGELAVNKQGYPVGVVISYLLSHEIVPQNLVVEHILPSATWKADARPKDIEVWAYIAEINMRSRVEDFSASHFPPNPREKWLEDGWVKISQFTYESNDATGGAHVHQFSPELEKLGAATDQIIIRAASNHGADHTCFYRNRLFGKRLV